jgi:hypothetical protein
MTRLRRLVCGSLAALAAAPAAAQSLPAGYYLEGELSFDNLRVDGDSENLGYADVTFGGSFGAGSPFGFMLGVDAISFDSVDEVAFYGALTWSVGPGVVSVGVPRFVVDDYITAPNPGGTEFTDVALAFLPLNGSLARNLYLLDDDVEVYGLRYDGSYGALEVGASAHRIDATGDDGMVYNIGGTYELGFVDVMGAVEVISIDSSTRGNTYLGISYEEAQFGAGALYTNVQTLGNVDAMQLWGSYEVLPDLTATANYQTLLGEDFDIIGLDVEYSPGGQFFVRGGAVTGDLLGNDDLYSVGLGYRF